MRVFLGKRAPVRAARKLETGTKYTIRTLGTAKHPEATRPEVPDLYTGRTGRIRQNFLAYVKFQADDAETFPINVRFALKHQGDFSCARVSSQFSSSWLRL